jgi:hypothetical protein
MSFVLGSTSTMFSSLHTLFFGNTLSMAQVLHSKYVCTLIRFDQLNMCKFSVVEDVHGQNGLSGTNGREERGQLGKARATMMRRAMTEDDDTI